MTKVQACLAENIKRYRKERHLTQEKLAELVGTSTTYIGTIEIGKKFPSPQMIERIATALQVDSLQLFQHDPSHSKGCIMPNITTLKTTLLTDIQTVIEKSFAELQ